MNAGDIIELTPKTRKGKNALQNKVNEWAVLIFSNEVAFSFDKGWMMIVERRDDDKEPDVRWVQEKGDKNFNFTPIEQ
tara:strand:+ start:4323 stop:4556 length:234 start_codon:yes stop_codon:yes gene_type:complete